MIHCFLNFSNMQHVFICGTMTSASGAHATYFFWYCRWKWCIVPTSQSSSNTPICKRTGGMNPVCFSFLATFAVWTFVCHCLNAVSPSYIQLLTSECIHVYTIYIEGGMHLWHPFVVMLAGFPFTMMFEFVPIHGRPSYLYMHKPAIVVLWSADEPRTRHTKSCDCIESRIFIGSRHRPNKFQ